MTGADLVVTNFNRNFTGVSATAAAVTRIHIDEFETQIVGQPLPECPSPVSKKFAVLLAREGSVQQPFQIWHVRRNSEMQLALYVRDILRLPIKIVFTSAAQRLHSRWPRWLISRMDAVIATTQAAASYVNNTVATIPHGVDTTRFTPSQNRTDDWAKSGYPGSCGIACIGRIRPEKGTDRFVDTAIQALQQKANLTALVIGKATREHTAFLAKLKQQVANAGLAEKILFIGEASPEDLPGLLRSLSLLVALPRYEGYGMTPLEAMASGVPIIASDTGHFQEFIGNNDAGFIIPLGDAEKASATILKLLQNKNIYQSMAKRCVVRAHEQFNVTSEARDIAAVYSKLWRNAPSRDL